MVLDLSVGLVLCPEHTVWQASLLLELGSLICLLWIRFITFINWCSTGLQSMLFFRTGGQPLGTLTLAGLANLRHSEHNSNAWACRRCSVFDGQPCFAIG